MTTPDMNAAFLSLGRYVGGRGGKLPQLTLRRAFVWTRKIDGGDGQRPAPYAELSSGARAGGLRPKLYLLLRWLASPPNEHEDGSVTYDTRRHVDQLCLWLGRCGPGGVPGAEDRKALFKTLEALEKRKLIDVAREEEGRRRFFRAWLRHELDGSSPFVPPHATADRDHPHFDGGYFSIPHELITNGWLTWLPPHALHLLLVVSRLQSPTRPRVGLPDGVRSSRAIIPHSEDLSVAGCILKAVGLVRVTEPSQGDELVRELEFRPDALKKERAPRVPLELYTGGKRVSIHGKGGIRGQLSAMEIDVSWPRPTR